MNDLEQNISRKQNKVVLKTGFELFYQSLLKSISHILEEDICAIKTKLCGNYEKHSNIQVPYKYKQVLTKKKLVLSSRTRKGM